MRQEGSRKRWLVEVVRGQPSQLGAKGLDAPRPHRDDIVAVLERAVDVQEGLLHQDEPLAVPGLWRTTTAPATRTARPSLSPGRSMARATRRRSSRSRWKTIG